MANRAIWAKRVAEWRASGLTSERFCARRDFTAGGLRNAAHTIESAAREVKVPTVRVARVLRVAAPALIAARRGAISASPVVVEVGGARVSVERGFDRSALAVVLELLAVRGAR